MSRALNEQYSDLLQAAGYINEHDLDEINVMLQDMLKPMFDDNVVDVLKHWNPNDTARRTFEATS